MDPIRCRKCRRVLKTPESRAAEVGPTCAKKEDVPDKQEKLDFKGTDDRAHLTVDIYF